MVRMLELANYQISHIPQLQGLLNNSKISEWLLQVPYPYTGEDAEAWVEKTAAMAEEAQPIEVPRVILSQGKVAGGIGLSKINDHSAELGYWVGEPFWRRGIASAAIRQMVDYGFGRLGLVRIHAHTFEGNISSERLLEKCGFVHEGFLRKFYRKHDKLINANLYAMVRE